MILLNNIVEILYLLNFNGRTVIAVEFFDCGFIGSAAINDHLFKDTILLTVLTKNRLEVFLSRFLVSKKSILLPTLSTAW